MRLEISQILWRLPNLRSLPKYPPGLRVWCSYQIRTTCDSFVTVYLGYLFDSIFQTEIKIEGAPRKLYIVISYLVKNKKKKEKERERREPTGSREGK